MKTDLCSRHFKMLERLGEAMRPIAKEFSGCEERGCEWDNRELDDVIIGVVNAWRAGIRAGLWSREEPRRKLRK